MIQGLKGEARSYIKKSAASAQYVSTCTCKALKG